MGFVKKYIDGRLPHLIGYVPSPVRKGIVKTHAGPGDNHYDEADDRRVVRNTGSKGAWSWMGWSLLGFCVFFISGGYSLTQLLIIIFPALGLLWLGRYTPEKYIVLDRTTGHITYPDWLFKPPHTVPIEEVTAFWVGTGGASGSLGQELSTNPPGSKRIINLRMHPGAFDKSWSFILWYLDRNRPLPPGEAFDEYRARDFARRKSEGFPPPLFPSRFPTPEATPEQNAERRRYWCDEDYYGASDTAWY